VRGRWRRSIAIYEILTFVVTGWDVVLTLAKAPARVPAIYIVGVLALADAAVSLVAGLWLGGMTAEGVRSRCSCKRYRCRISCYPASSASASHLRCRW
jgi:hypothetical protein